MLNKTVKAILYEFYEFTFIFSEITRWFRESKADPLCRLLGGHNSLQST